MNSIKLSAAVGVGGLNRREDVSSVQKLLNNFVTKIGIMKLVEDGFYGPRTRAAIEKFQRVQVGMFAPDGRVDPGGRTLRALAQAGPSLPPKPHGFMVVPNLRFPLREKPKESYRDGMRSFGWRRSGGRKHAGCDLYAPPGTEILALSDGKVVEVQEFYLSTKAVVVDHGPFLARYGEVSGPAPGVSKGATVSRGQVVGYVGELIFPSGTRMSMLHLELFKGNGIGPLTKVGQGEYSRRNDLLDPTPYLDQAVMQ